VADRFEKYLDTLADEVRDLDRVVARECARLRAANASLRMPDAIVIATGLVIKADHILTGDKRWRNIDPCVTVLDPRQP